MPILTAKLHAPAITAHKHLSYELQVCTWLSSVGLEVLLPLVDHGRKTDLVVHDDEGHYYRIQVKTVQTEDESARVDNKWKGARVDYVVYFSTCADWGYIAPAFTQASRRLNAPGHQRFQANRDSFLAAFTQA